MTAGSLERDRFEASAIAGTAFLIVVGFFVIYPTFLIILNSFQLAQPNSPSTFGLSGWRTAFSEPGIRRAIYNTFTLLLARQLISFPVAVFLAWLLARTDLPGKRAFEFLFWLSFFLPPLSITLGWILLLDPEYGITNQLWAGLAGAGRGPFNIYSFWGIVWAHLMTNTLTVKVILITPAFRNMDAALEDASRVAGASTVETTIRILLPLMSPALMVVLILAVVYSLQAFEIEMILGTPIGLHVYSTLIYKLINQEPPLYNSAMALGSVILFVLFPFILLQQWYIRRRAFTTVTGRYQSRVIALRRLRYPAFVLMAGITLLLTILPVGLTAMGTFMSLFGFFHIESAWTLANWKRVFADPLFAASLRNTLALSSAAALLAVTVFPLIAYIIVKTRYRWRWALDFISWLPSAVPGILQAIGLLWLFLDTAFLRPFYGSIWLLIAAMVIVSVTFGTQILKASLIQISDELEEASRASGASWATTFMRILAPLALPSVVAVGLVVFIQAARDISTVALLASSQSRTLALLQLDFMVEGRYESAAVVATLVTVLTTGVAVVARFLGLRLYPTS